MKQYIVAFFLAVLVVLTGMSLRHSVAAIGGSPVPVPPYHSAIGGSPVPVPPYAVPASQLR